MELFDIPREAIPSMYMLGKSGVLKSDYWGKGCGFRSIRDSIIVKSILPHIPKTKLTKNLDIDNVDIRYIIYNINGKYTISDHKDYCDATIIIYMYKNHKIHTDDFHIKGKKISGQWSNNVGYRAIIFDGYSVHGGILEGEGQRKVLVLHFNKH